jgi:hypothetical protein
MTDFDINRRRLLGVLGGTGVAAYLGLGYATGDPVRYTYASSHSCDGYTLDAEWRETYTRDGETTLLENTTSSDGAAPGGSSVIQLSNVLPGDRGTVSFTVTADRTDTDASDTVSPTLGFDIVETAENGLIDPEEEAGDTTENTGELQEYLDLTIWENTGILGVDALGADDLTQQITEDTIAEGTFAEVADALNDEPLGSINTSADSDESVSVTLRWEFADDAGINETQTDSVTFTLDIGCGGD